MTSPILNSSILPVAPVSLTTNKDSRPVSVRTATENEIDQINNSPMAKKLYNAKVYGGVLGAVIPLGLAITGVFKAGSNWQNKKFTSAAWAGAAAIGAALTIKGAQIGASVSNALTIFFNTRGKSPTEKE